MKTNNPGFSKEYWEKNIEAFSGFYDRGSEEAIDAVPVLRWLYRTFLFPIEKKYMRRRYEMVSKYIDRHIRPGMKAADIGCGSGIFTRMMAAKGAYVYAIDYAESALALIRRSLTEADLDSIELIKADITKQSIPKIDTGIAIGVLTYIQDSNLFFDHVLPFTDRLLFNIIDKHNLLNHLRRALPILDVRHLAYHARDSIEAGLTGRGFRMVHVEPLATGLMISCEKDS